MTDWYRLENKDAEITVMFLVLLKILNIIKRVNIDPKLNGTVYVNYGEEE